MLPLYHVRNPFSKSFRRWQYMYMDKYWKKVESVYVQEFQHLINSTLCSVEFPKSLAGGVGNLLFQWFYTQFSVLSDPTFISCNLLLLHLCKLWFMESLILPLVIGLRFILVCFISPTLSCTKHVLFKSTGITLQICGNKMCKDSFGDTPCMQTKIVAISCSSTGVLLCTWDIIFSVATGLASKARTTSKPFLYTTS